MEEQQSSGKKNLPFIPIWIGSIIIVCAVFIIVSIPRVQAQSRQQDMNSNQYVSIIRNVFDFIQRHYVEEVDAKVLFEGAMTGMFESLEDPYSSYLVESEMTDLSDTTQGNFGGVGLMISKPVYTDGRPSFVEVASPIEDTPGWRAGINPGDLIVEINGESTAPLSMEEILARLRGAPGEKVELLIRRGEKLEFPVTIVKAVIEVPTTKFAMINDVGYLKLLTFTPMTVGRAAEAIMDFRSKGYKGIILDLRNNYGGLLDSAVKVTNLFIEDGVVVSTKSRIPQDNNVYYARAKALVDSDIPVVVLINRGSASASEIVAGALKDRGRAYLVGEKSFGKGSVQQVYPVNAVGFKLTTARYYTPSDVNIDKIGIPPDMEVLFPEFADSDMEALNRLYEDNVIADFFASSGSAADPSLAPDELAREPRIESSAVRQGNSIDAFAEQLHEQYGLDISLLKRLIRDEQNRTSIAPVYDLEYDIQLQAAVEILKSGNFRSLMGTTKTLKVLQEESLEDEDFAQAS